jgi:1-deoxy-D-xylulose-5-phosphate reductoisomerase
VAILGATGSIGRATIEVIRSLGSGWSVAAVSAHRSCERLSRAVRQTGAPTAVLSGLEGDSGPPGDGHLSLETMGQEDHAAESAAAGGDTQTRAPAAPPASWPPEVQVEYGPDALVRVARSEAIDIVVAAIVGRAGVESTLAALEAGKRVALANKETLVCAGPIVEQLLYGEPSDPQHPRPLVGHQLLPVDSEHSAIFQCLPSAATLVGTPSPAGGGEAANVARLILTASGGPFRETPLEQMREATVAEALNHPTWKMGKKITIDSATMMNKALEIIEARWLFGFSAAQLDVLVHPQSIIHSMVEYRDGALLAQLSPPDMRLPIQYALTYPHRRECPAPPLDRTKWWELTLQPVDHERFPAIPLGFEVAAAGGTAGSVVNAANEAAVDLFLEERIRFTDIVPACRAVLEHHTYEARPTLARLLELDEWARAEVRRWSCRTLS